MTLVLDCLRVTLGERLLVALTAEVRPGRPLVIMGPSGSGKSTALAAIAGTLDPAFGVTGAVRLNGRAILELPTRARRIGLMFQDDILFPHLSVGQNLGFGLSPAVKGAARRTRIAEALAEIDLAGFAQRDPATLSGGQRARVALMRSLLAEPEALLLDEPFARLDTDLRQHVRALTFAACRDLPVILVTHDAEDARAAGGAVVTPLGETVQL